MGNRLFVLTSSFPYGSGEEFLVEESNYYGVFDQTYIIPLGDYDPGKIKNYNKQNNIEIVNIKGKSVRKARKIIECLGGFAEKEFWREIAYLLKKKNLNIYSTKQVLRECYKVYRLLPLVERKLESVREEFPNDKVVVYCYWMSIHAKIACELKKRIPNISVVSRCHGYDLYEYRYQSDYIPFHHDIIGQLDKIFAISTNGKEYLEKRYLDCSNNIVVSRLGSKDVGTVRKRVIKDQVFRLVSCSYCIPLKRIHRIIEALSEIKEYEVEWTHIGDGVELEKLKEKATSMLGENVKAVFKGYLSNDKVVSLYSMENFHFFINVSETEGIPVSIMEALSCGIPVIATDVGGVSEMIFDKENGFLLDKDFRTEDLVNCFRKIHEFEQQEYEQMSEKALFVWNERYNAEKNYRNFVAELLHMEKEVI